MLIALDIGNTNIKSAIFDGDHLIDYNVHPNAEDFIEYIRK
jgi:pantothenate kinase type III